LHVGRHIAELGREERPLLYVPDNAKIMDMERASPSTR
jgi:hypothetical protein